MKTYLKDLTPEEIIKRLKNGEIIENEEGDDTIIKYYDGVICRVYEDGSYEINVSFTTDAACVYYFETEEPLTFEQGKFYKTREGKKAYISKITTTYIYGIITGKTSMDTWHLNGMRWHNGDKHKNDLISKWED